MSKPISQSLGKLQIFYNRPSATPNNLVGDLFMLLENTIVPVPKIVNGLGELKELPLDARFTLKECKHHNFSEELVQLRSGDEIPNAVKFCHDCSRNF